MVLVVVLILSDNTLDKVKQAHSHGRVQGEVDLLDDEVRKRIGNHFANQGEIGLFVEDLRHEYLANILQKLVDLAHTLLLIPIFLEL